MTVTFAEACTLVETALAARREILAGLGTSRTLAGILHRLRDGMRSHVWKASARSIRLDTFVSAYDTRTRDDGFHVMNDWDGVADRVNDDMIPVDVLHYVIDQRGDQPATAAAPAILLDYYFLHVLALMSLRIWDSGDADDNLDQLTRLLQKLQGPHGGGQQFVDDAETLMLIGTSHFEVREDGFATLLDRVRTLNHAHRLRIALTHAASLGSHLRFGYEATYAGSDIAMRADNVADYPWLCFALATLMENYAGPSLRLAALAQGEAGREVLVEALLNGLSPDAAAFLREPPASLASSSSEWAGCRDLLLTHRASLLTEFERHRPTDRAYSPLSFFFNFSHNVLKGTVIDALLWGEPTTVTFNDLLSGSTPGTAKSDAKTTLARTLMGYARANPDRIRGRLMPVIVYDPQAGRRAFAATMAAIRQA